MAAISLSELIFQGSPGRLTWVVIANAVQQDAIQPRPVYHVLLFCGFTIEINQTHPVGPSPAVLTRAASRFTDIMSPGNTLSRHERRLPQFQTDLLSVRHACSASLYYSTLSLLLVSGASVAGFLCCYYKKTGRWCLNT